jgi:hypothetical protein
MNTVTEILSLAVIGAALTCSAATALAGAADVRNSDGRSMKFEYKGDDLLRVNMGNEDAYMIRRDDTMYMVSNADGQLMVVDMSQALNMFAGMAQGATPDTVEGKLLSMKATGRKETVAGIKGEVYEARFIDDKGKERTAELVLAKDKRAVDFQRAMFGMISSMAGAAGADTSAAIAMQNKLSAMNMGVLRYDDEMWVANISDRKIDASRFELPAEPMDLSALGGIMGAAGGGGASAGESGGGFVSGILGALGGKANSQGERAGDKAEKEADEKTDNALNKAFDKLFGK